MMRAMRTTHLLLALALGCSPWLAAPSSAATEEDEAFQQARQYYQQGLAAYQQGRYDDAIRALRRAQLLRPSPLLLLNLGRTYRAAGQADQALPYFEKYLKEAPEGDKERKTAEKAVVELKAEQAAQKSKGEVGPKLLFVHHPVDALPANEPPRIWAYLVAPKGSVAKVHYRKAGQSAFEAAPMKPQDGEESPALMAELPAAIGKARHLQYYVEVRDSSGALLRSSGSAGSPHLVVLDALARARGERPSWNLDDK